MRKINCFLLAAALVSAPAFAQDDPTADNAVDANTVSTMPVDNGVETMNDLAAMNDVAAVPEAAPVEPAPAAVPSRSSGGGIPWGAVGLVGLIGLMGRKRRD